MTGRVKRLINAIYFIAIQAVNMRPTGDYRLAETYFVFNKLNLIFQLVCLHLRYPKPSVEHLLQPSTPR